MRDLNYALKQRCDRNHDGSYAMQHDRARSTRSPTNSRNWAFGIWLSPA